MSQPEELDRLNAQIVACRACPRLVEWRETVARDKRASFARETYWGRPVPSFGDPTARLLIVGLAPAAHGGNRTGRIFTGDRSGDWLFASLYRMGFANQAESRQPGDGLRLTDAYIAAAVRCAPPANKPTRDERDRCSPYLTSEVKLLSHLQVIVALGAFAWDATVSALGEATAPGEATARRKARPRFGHGARADAGTYRLLGCFHPSQQNTFTGVLTEPMIDAVFSNAREMLR